MHWLASCPVRGAALGEQRTRPECRRRRERSADAQSPFEPARWSARGTAHNLPPMPLIAALRRQTWLGPFTTDRAATENASHIASIADGNSCSRRNPSISEQADSSYYGAWRGGRRADPPAYSPVPFEHSPGVCACQIAGMRGRGAGVTRGVDRDVWGRGPSGRAVGPVE